MSKVYVYYYDNSARILVGSGGTKGNPPQARLGFHLPGGTAWKARGVGMPRIHGLASALREVKEEFGIWRADQLAADTLGMNASYNALVYGEDLVYFVGVQLTAGQVDAMVGDITDGIGGPSDSPFTECHAMYVGTAKHLFLSSGNDWFVDGFRFLPFVVR